jgi:MGT family glycosyltransferase
VKRFLFVVPPLAGHVNPTISIARELALRGHQVAWVAHARRVRPMLPEDAEVLPLDEDAIDEHWNPALGRAKNVRGLESFQFLWEELLVPLARAMRPGVRRAIDTWHPDVVVVDHQAIGGALAARQARTRWATLCTTSASVVNALSGLPKVEEWVALQLTALQREAGLPVTRQPDLSPELVIVLSTEAFASADVALPSHYRFVGPSISDRPDATPFPWDELRDVPRVFVSLGTVSAERSDAFYRTVVEALADEPLQVVLAAPPHALANVNVPPSFIVRARVPQLALLPRVHAVVSHGGHNTVCESLANGLPLVVTPIRDDQPVIANQVVRAGAGLRLKFGRLSASALRSAVRRVLDEPEFRAAAESVRDSFASAGGANAAASLLESMT